MKMEWIEPKIEVQKFVPDEYVAICWSVACIVDSGDYGGYGSNDDWEHWDGNAPYGNECHNHTGSCSNAVNNQFTVDANGNVSFYAENSSEQGSLDGGYTSYIDKDSSGTINDGDTIFWYTLSSDGNRRWNHYGEVDNPTPDHPNRS